MRYVAVFAALLGVVLAACGSSSDSSPSTSTVASSRSSGTARSGSATAAAETGSLCGFRDSPPTTYQHVMLLIQENKSAKQIIGSKDYSYLNQTLIPQCGLAKNYHSTSHPSLPNYLALTSGTTNGKAGRSNCQPKECPQAQDSIFAQIERSGREWRQYAQGA